MSLNIDSERHILPERDFLEEMEDGNDAQVFKMDRIRSQRDLEVLRQTLGWQEHVAEWTKEFHGFERKFAEEAERRDRKYRRDLAEVWNIRITI